MKYGIILADPPWSFKTWSAKGKDRSPDKHYPVQSLDWIKNLRVQDIAADDCALFLWATCPTMPQALQVIEAWGFTYKTTAFVWVKENKKSPTLFTGLGYWTRSNAEICLLATRGKPKRVNNSVHQVIVSRIREHSQKPDECRERIVQLMGDNIPRIELFARDQAEGWHTWGNQCKCDIDLIGMKGA